jgi:hypothetical protein
VLIAPEPEGDGEGDGDHQSQEAAPPFGAMKRRPSKSGEHFWDLTGRPIPFNERLARAAMHIQDAICKYCYLPGSSVRNI